MPDGLDLSSLKPAAKQRPRKRVGRGLGSGKGRYAGRGIKGQKSRAGSHQMRAGFEGGQMPAYMRMAKQRGSTSKDAMPIGPFRTHTIPINVAALDRFDDGAEVTPEALVAARLIKNTKTDVKILGNGELTKSLRVAAHAFSRTAREKIEGAGGSVELLRGDPEAKPKRRRSSKKTAPETGETASAETEAGAKGTAHEPDAAVDVVEATADDVSEEGESS